MDILGEEMIDKKKIIELKTKFKQLRGKQYIVPIIVGMMMIDELLEERVITLSRWSKGYRFTGNFFKLLQLNPQRANNRVRELLPDYYVQELLKQNLIEVKTLDEIATRNIDRDIEIDRKIYIDRDKSREFNSQGEEKFIPIIFPKLKGIHLAEDYCKVMAYNLMGDKFKKGKKPPLFVEASDIFKQMNNKYQFMGEL